MQTDKKLCMRDDHNIIDLQNQTLVAIGRDHVLFK